MFLQLVSLKTPVQELDKEITKKKLSNKVISALRLPSKCSFTPSKLRFFGLRKVAIKESAKQMGLFCRAEATKSLRRRFKP